MSYTLWSHGRLLGSTELEFTYRDNGHRTGWFRPEPGVQDILDVATGVSLALYSASRADDPAEAYADVEAAGDRERALELELRDADGRTIATEDIGLRDVVFLMTAYGDVDEQAAQRDAWYATLSDEERAEFDAAVAHDAELMAEWEAELEEEQRGEGWKADPESFDPDAEDVARTADDTAEQRYQLQITLVDHFAIP